MQNNAGGEIYVNELTQINAMLYQVLSTIIDNIHNTTPVDFKNLNISPQLTDNTGPLGNSIYGSILGEHPWLNPNSNDANVFNKMRNQFNSPLQTGDVINTEVSVISTNLTLFAVPGKPVTMNITAYYSLK